MDKYENMNTLTIVPDGSVFLHYFEIRVTLDKLMTILAAWHRDVISFTYATEFIIAVSFNISL